MSTDSNSTYLPDRKVAERYGVSVRTLDRWDRTPSLGFPRPTYIRDRKYRNVELLERFERDRAVLAGQRTKGAQPSALAGNHSARAAETATAVLKSSETRQTEG
jgi:hypothetical protein